MSLSCRHKKCSFKEHLLNVRVLLLSFCASGSWISFVFFMACNVFTGNVKECKCFSFLLALIYLFILGYFFGFDYSFLIFYFNGTYSILFICIMYIVK